MKLQSTFCSRSVAISQMSLRSVFYENVPFRRIRLVSIAAQRYITELISKSVDYQKQRQLSESAKEVVL